MASDMTEGMLLDLLPQLKTLVSAPSTVPQARAIIDSHPQLTYSLMKTMVALGLVDSNVVTKKIAASQPAAPPPVPDMSQHPPIPAQPVVSQPQPSYHDMTPHPSTSSSRPTPAQEPSAQAPSITDGNPSTSRTTSRFGPPISAPNAVGTPPVTPAATNTAQAPASQNQTAAVAAAINALPPDQRNTIVQILSLTPDQINAMPPEGRTRITEVRRSILGPGA